MTERLLPPGHAAPARCGRDVLIHRSAPMTATFSEHQLDALGIQPSTLGEGGAADIYRCTTADGHPMVFKRYNADALRNLDVAALRHLIAWPAQLPDEDRRRLMNICAWPEAVVVDSGAVIGILMAPASQQFFFRDRNDQLKPCHFELVGVRQELAQKRQWPYFDFPHKIARLGYLLEDLQFLHSHDVVVGDLQIKNILTTSPEPDAFGITTTEILLLDCDSFIVDGHAALPPMDPPNMQIPHLVNGHSATTDLAKFALVVIRCLSETLTADAINYDKFNEILPSSHFAKLEKLLTEQNPGLTSADLGNMAKAWQATVKKDGRLYCRTDASLWDKWTPQKRRVHLAGIVPPQPQAQPSDSKPSKSKPASGKPAKSLQTNRTGGASREQWRSEPSSSEDGEASVSPPQEPKSTGLSQLSIAGGLVAVTIVTVAIGLTIVSITNAGNHSNTASSSYTTTTVITTKTAVTATTGPASPPADQSGYVVRNAQIGDCITMTFGASKNADGTDTAIVGRSSCGNHAWDSYRVIRVSDDLNACTGTWVQTEDLPRKVLCLVNN
jgi:hypothetical protein